MYYLAKSISSAPGLNFQLIATSLEELESLGYSRSSAFVVTEEVIKSIPFNYGVYLQKLNDKGKLIDFTEEEVNMAKSTFAPIAKKQIINKLSKLSIEIDLAEKLGEITTNLQTEFNQLKSEYEELSNIIITEAAENLITENGENLT